MALSSLFKRKRSDDDAGVAPAPPQRPVRRGPGRLPPQASADRAQPPRESAAVAHARIQARRRLTGAAVLLLLGIVLFPLVLETQPRPLPMDLPITVAPGHGAGTAAPPVQPPVQKAAPVVAVAPSAPWVEEAPARPPPVVAASASSAAVSVPPVPALVEPVKTAAPPVAAASVPKPRTAAAVLPAAGQASAPAVPPRASESRCAGVGRVAAMGDAGPWAHLAQGRGSPLTPRPLRVLLHSASIPRQGVDTVS
jgi:DedD protein